MLKSSRFLWLGIIFILLSDAAYAADALGFAKKILSLADLKCEYGWGVDTYEDVIPIKQIRPMVSGIEPMLDPGKLDNGGDLTKMVKESDGKKVLNEINKNGGVICRNENFINFLNKHFYLDSGSYGDEEVPVWHDQKIEKFPYPYDPGKKPHTKRFFLCLKKEPTWHFIPPAGDVKPDAISCEVNKSLCNYDGVCKKEEIKTDLNNDLDFDDPGEKETKEEHHQTTPNVYTKLGDYLKSLKTECPGVEMDQSGVEFKLIFKDRTPPTIEGCAEDKFPELGTNRPATTGDWYKIEGLKISDNSSKYIGTCLALGKIDKIPALDWTSEENWVTEPPRALKSGDDSDYIIMPNACHGVMRYSVFAWDQSGNVNPGEPNIEQDTPGNCYGLRNPPDGVTDLGDIPNKALPWPIVASWPAGTGDIDETNIEKIDMTTVKPGDRRSEGYVHIRDNDLPNVLVRIESVKDGSKMFFPPVMPPGSLPIFNSTEFDKAAADPDGNAKVYRNFVGITPEVKFDTTKLADANLKLPIYFKVLAAAPRKILSSGDIGIHDDDRTRVEFFKDTAKLEFTKTHVRLEDYNQSDTRPDGSLENNEGTFGARNGFGGEICALLTEPLQEDVEYKISIWVDDNVKWATVDEANKVLEKIIAVPTGVVAGEVKVEVPNQYPTASYRTALTKDKAVSEPLTVVFREPTPDFKGEPSEKALDSQKFPYIMATATDYAGLTRKIKLYVAVSNENPEIRVLERTHEKNKD